MTRESFDLQGHRGARGLRPENTIPSFRRALELGVSTLEMDVVISADRHVVVSHEPWFSDKICSKPDGSPVGSDEADSLRIYEMSYDDIRKYDCGRRGHPDFPRQIAEPACKPLLRDVIAMAEQYVKSTGRRDVEYNIETKSTPKGDGVLHPAPAEFTGLLYGVLKQTGVLGRSTIQSFDRRTLRVARTLDPDWRTSLLVGRSSGYFISFNLGRLGFDPSIYSPHHRSVTRHSMRHARRLGIRVIPWTVNEESDMKRMLSLGVDGFITDYPDRAMDLLERFLSAPA